MRGVVETLDGISAKQGVQTELGVPNQLPSVHDRTIQVQVQTTGDSLVIDDNPDIGDLFRRVLAKRRYRTIHARTVERAFRVLRDTPPDVIVLDVIMPSLDGWELLTTLRQNVRHRRDSGHRLLRPPGPRARAIAQSRRLSPQAGLAPIAHPFARSANSPRLICCKRAWIC